MSFFIRSIYLKISSLLNLHDALSIIFCNSLVNSDYVLKIQLWNHTLSLTVNNKHHYNWKIERFIGWVFVVLSKKILYYISLKLKILSYV